MTFFSSPFHRLENETINFLDPLYTIFSNNPKLLIEKIPIQWKYIDKEDYPNFSEILLDHLQQQNQYQFQILSSLSISQIPHSDLESISSNISRHSQAILNNQNRIYLKTEETDLADGFDTHGAVSVSVHPVRLLNTGINSLIMLKIGTTELDLNANNTTAYNLIASFLSLGSINENELTLDDDFTTLDSSHNKPISLYSFNEYKEPSSSLSKPPRKEEVSILKNKDPDINSMNPSQTSNEPNLPTGR
jgi:hypothetical protein